MKYAVWFIRLIYAAWLIPAGLNHFYSLYPQPLGNMPLSIELFAALRDSHLFDLVKAVELVAGISILTGFYLPLSLVLLMPVSVNVWYWDVPLQGWESGSARYGWAILSCNVILLAAYWRSYAALLTPKSAALLHTYAKKVGAAVPALRMLFGAWMVLGAVNALFVHALPLPEGTQPLAVQLIGAVIHSGLIEVVLWIQLIAGALLIAGLWVPLALCVLMPLSVCGAYWAVMLEQDPAWSALALLAVAINALLCLAHLGAYRDMLKMRALAIGETAKGSFDCLLANPIGGTALTGCALALLPLLAAYAFYHQFIFGPYKMMGYLVLLIPSAILLARSAQGMMDRRG